MTIRGFLTVCLALFGFVAAAVAAERSAPSPADAAINFAIGEAVLDLGPALAERRVADASAPDGMWFTVTVRNSTAIPVARVLAVPALPRAGLAFVPQTKRAALVDAAGSDSSVVVERDGGFGANAFRVVVPSAGLITLALHFQGVSGRPVLLAWTESAFIEHNRQVAILTGAVLGLLAAAAAFALGAAVLSGTMLSRWAALFLASILFLEFNAAQMFDNAPFVTLSGPHALFALALAGTLAAGVRLLDRIAPFAVIHPKFGFWREVSTLVLVILGALAYANVPLAGLILRVLAVAGAAAAAAYLAHCGRTGNAVARRLAPAATTFALVTAAAACNALGLFGINLVASSAIAGFSAAGALLVAIATAVPLEPVAARPREAEAGSHAIVPRWVKDAKARQERELAAVSASHQGVFDLDLHSGLVSLSAEASQLLGLPPGAVELSPEAWLNRIHPDDQQIYQEALAIYRRDPGIAFRLEFRARGSAGETAWFELRATMTGQATEAERCLGLIANVTARKSAEAVELAPAATDALTGLGTRAALLQRLEVSRGELKQAVLALFDLDRFKSVNDSLGRDDGDALLIALARRLAEDDEIEGRDKTAFFRVGGDMFAAVAHDVANLEVFGQRFVDMLSMPFVVAGREIFIPASVGVAAGAQADETQDFLTQAELAMVEAKRQGGGRVCVYSRKLGGDAPGDLIALETDLRRALERDEIELHYQPIVRLKDGVVSGFEALARWRHPERGMIEPQAFVPQAERSGLIVPLGRRALERAAEDLARWQQFFPSKPALFVSVNVTWRQIVDQNFAKDLAALLKTAGLAKGSLRLEVTESAVMAGALKAETALKRLKTLGASLAIDDFGTGHSSLSHLTRFPFDTIKIDKSFLAATKDNTGFKILASIVSLALELKLSVVAEGVETPEEVARLKEMGCEYGQGYFLGIPVPASEINGVIVKAQAR